jgi:predicted nucleic acid-binding protein
MGSEVIVADTNLVAYLLLKGDNSPAALRARAKDRNWAAPPLLCYELANIFGQSMRQNRLERDEATRMYRRAMSLVRIEAVQPDPLDIFKLVESSESSPYDLQFVWLAMELNVQLVTADRKLAEAFPDVAVLITEFAPA